MAKPKNIKEAMRRAQEYGTPTYLMLADEVESLRESMAEIREIWAGSDSMRLNNPTTAYAVRLCNQMYNLACGAIKKDG